tara:strand:- start:139 stop:522 length:384 start_codon:yes stop_codon:yes gene_type:complete
MLRTNSKKYLQNIERYLLEQIDGTDYKVKTDTPLEKMNFVFDCFEKEYECEYERRRTPNNQKRFADYLSGLPSCINIPCYYVDIIALAKELQEVKGDFTKAQEEKICSNHFNFMAYQIIKLKDRIIN